MRPTIKGNPSKSGSRSLYPYFPIEDTVHDHNYLDFKYVACQDRRVKVHDIEFIMLDMVEGRRIGWGVWYPLEFIEHGAPDWTREIRRV